MPTTAFQPLGDRSSALLMKLPAALLIRMSIRPKCRTTRVDHLVDLLGLPHVDLDRLRIEPRVTQLRRAALEMFGVPAANRDERAELAEPRGDRRGRGPCRRR